MNKLRALTAFLIERRLMLPEQIDSWAEEVTLPLYWKPTTEGLHMGDMRYHAVIAIERLSDEPARLMALVGSWLETHDPHRDDLSAPTFEIDQLDPDLADVELQLDFVEPQYLTESATGEIEAFNTRWDLVPFDLWTAERGEVSHART